MPEICPACKRSITPIREMYYPFTSGPPPTPPRPHPYVSLFIYLLPWQILHLSLIFVSLNFPDFSISCPVVSIATIFPAPTR